MSEESEFVSGEEEDGEKRERGGKCLSANVVSGGQGKS